MKRASALFAAALALPVIGLGWTWLSADQLSRQGTDWQVAVRGYDPHDILRGHYVQFNYEWPGLKRPRDDYAPIRALCIEGSGGVVASARIVDPDKAGCANLARSSSRDKWGMSTLEMSRLYASEEEAMRIQEALADRKQQGMVTFRLREDGHVTPLRITFRPRTAAELKALDDADAAMMEAADAPAEETVPPAPAASPGP